MEGKSDLNVIFYVIFCNGVSRLDIGQQYGVIFTGHVKNAIIFRKRVLNNVVWKYQKIVNRTLVR